MTQLAVFGASGRVGQLLVDLAVARGVGVRALVRPTTGFEARPGVVVSRGTLEEADEVAATLTGTAAAICVFGPRATTAAPFVARGTSNVISEMRVAGVRRLVCLTGAMVGLLPSNVSFAMKAMAGLYRRQVPALAADAAEQERLVMASGLDWVLVKPPRLTDAPAKGQVRAGPALRVGLLSSIRRGDLAAFMLDEATRAGHLRQRVYVSD